jgi:hypothetical protein
MSTCTHEDTFETRYPTSSGAYLIHEVICKKCKKVLLHESKEVHNAGMQETLYY